MTTNEQSDHQLSDVTTAVRSLVELMQANGLSKIDVTVGDVSIRLRAGGSRQEIVSVAPAPEVQIAPPAVLAPAPVGYVVTAPMIGTFYASSGPGEAPFVRVGDRIEAGQTIGIIEAMKIMNEIPADRGGIVIEIMVANTQAVEYGSPLLRITPDEMGG